jgi:thiamine-phosphate pyrophosphorylase
MTRFPGEILRILDANANRALEGIRVLEEAARMVFSDPALTGALKDVRHEVVKALADAGGAGSRMIFARDSEGDILREGETPSERARADLAGVIRANARRACEAARSIEEYGKLVDEDVSGRFKRIRFRLYDLEKRLVERAARRELLSPGRLGVGVVIDCGNPGDDAEAMTATAVDAGAGSIVLRRTASDDRAFLAVAERCVAACRGAEVTVLAESRADLAVMLGADGVVLGPDDAPPALARPIVGGNRLVGSSDVRGGLPSSGDDRGADFLLLPPGADMTAFGDVLRDSPVLVVAMLDPGDERGEIPGHGVAGVWLRPGLLDRAAVARIVRDVREEFDLRGGKSSATSPAVRPERGKRGEEKGID